MDHDTDRRGKFWILIFDVLHTEMCSADSLLQRLGRCNRKGKMYPDEVNCMIYNNRNGVYKGKGKGVYEQSLYDSSLNALKKYEGMIFYGSDETGLYQ